MQTQLADFNRMCDVCYMVQSGRQSESIDLAHRAVCLNLAVTLSSYTSTSLQALQLRAYEQLLQTYMAVYYTIVLFYASVNFV